MDAVRNTKKNWYTIDKNVFGWVPDCAFLNTLGEIGVRGHVERALDQFSVMICCSDEQKQELMDRLGSEYSLSYVPRGRAKAYFFGVGLAHHGFVKAVTGFFRA
ncbi:MAG: hypothetical protein IKQ97_04755 [Eubacterium sp.]|nr:hypothetical protein [Eubacterium sp.]